MSGADNARGACALRGGITLFVIAAIVRVNNALRFETNWGFDGGENWKYILRLRESWELPAPDAFWTAYHPPFFYLVGGGLARLFEPLGKAMTVSVIRGVSSLFGLIAIACCLELIRRIDPNNSRRLLFAAALMLFLPVHLYMSAMLSAEMTVASLSMLVVAGVAANQARPSSQPISFGYCISLGVLAGLACLTKLTGCLAVAVVASSILISGLRQGTLTTAIGRIAVFSLVVMMVGGWFYARNWIGYGYLYPQDLAVHQVMFTMPPGTRAWTDYLYVPLATWTQPQVLAPDLLRSVWGSTYVSMWFDGHRHFLSREGVALSLWGTTILTLALLPMTAFAIGVARGTKRALQKPDGADTPLLLLLIVTLAGYVAFTWGNPWFVTLKASFLLGLTLPFAFYSSEVLASWTRRPGLASRLIWALLVALLAAVLIVFTYGLVFSNPGPPGIQWDPLPVP